MCFFSVREQRIICFHTSLYVMVSIIIRISFIFFSVFIFFSNLNQNKKKSFVKSFVTNVEAAHTSIGEGIAMVTRNKAFSPVVLGKSLEAMGDKEQNGENKGNMKRPMMTEKNQSSMDCQRMAFHYNKSAWDLVVSHLFIPSVLLIST